MTITGSPESILAILTTCLCPTCQKVHTMCAGDNEVPLFRESRRTGCIDGATHEHFAVLVYINSYSRSATRIIKSCQPDDVVILHQGLVSSFPILHDIHESQTTIIHTMM